IFKCDWSSDVCSSDLSSRARARALARIAEGGRFLLYGPTGSGKTEVYLQAAAAALERGLGTIVLVPEIALAPQTVGRFRARFGRAEERAVGRVGIGAS